MRGGGEMITYLIIHFSMSLALMLMILAIMAVRPNIRIHDRIDLKYFMLIVVIFSLVPEIVLLIGFIDLVQRTMEIK